MSSQETFKEAALAALLWSETYEDENGEDISGWGNFEWADESDLDPVGLAAFYSDCDAFEAAHAELIEGREARAGHDFVLTRNGHGAGFWDGDWPEHGGDLSDACKPYGTVGLIWAGEDSKVEFV